MAEAIPSQPQRIGIFYASSTKMGISKIMGGVAGQSLFANLEISSAYAYTFIRTIAGRGTSPGLVIGNPIAINPRKALLCEFWTHYVHETGFVNSPSSA
jgi:hypothetical protein